jgi:hypothetical protein
MRRTWRALPAAVGVALVLAACGGTDEPAAPLDPLPTEDDEADPDDADDPAEDGDDPGDDPGEDAAGDDDGADEGAAGDDVGDDEVDVGALAAEVDAALEELGGDARVVEARPVTWSDGALGCPEPGMMYTQALVDGYRIILETGDGERVFFHGEDGQPPFRCDAPQEPQDGGVTS